MRIRSALSAALVAAILPLATFAQGAAPGDGSLAPSAGAIRDMDTVVVSGVQPGPGLWRISRDGHVMWVLGTLSPLPKKMDWEARDVEAAISAAQEVMLEPGVDVDVDAGFFGKLALAPRLYAARKNPQDKRLQEVVPAADYARWTALKRQYIGHDRGVEKWRPLFASARLYYKAVEDVGLRMGGVITPTVEKLARKHGITVSRPMVELTIEDPKQALSEFREARIDDLGCFRKTMARVESDLGRLRDRANAWAVGDIEGLRGIPFTRFTDCEDAWNGIQAMRSRAGDIEQRRNDEWFREAQRALSNNRLTFALLPMQELLADDGLAARLRAGGYTVEAPGEYLDGPAPQTGAGSGEAAGD